MQRFFKRNDHRSVQILLQKVDELESRLGMDLLQDEKAFAEYRRNLTEVRLLVDNTVQEFEREMQSPAMVNAIRIIKSSKKRSTTTMSEQLMAVVGKMHQHDIALCDARDVISDITRDLDVLWDMRRSLRMMHESQEDEAVRSIREKFQSMARSLRKNTEAEVGQAPPIDSRGFVSP